MDFSRSQIVFAPMEGVTDAPMREWIGGVADFDYGVTEFIRVSESVLPKKIFYRDVPEIRTDCKTKTGLTVQVQLLGGSEERLAATAKIACEAGAQGIDLNFGCPAPTVNRNDGGATLLKYPERLESIVAAVRAAVPAEYPVSAKLRLGFDDPSVILENARRVVKGGASWITIHARTKVNGYQPPAFWKLLRPVVEEISIPVIANGDIWTLQDLIQCQADSGARHFMLGRGGLANPFLAASARQYLETGERVERRPPPTEWREFFVGFVRISEGGGIEGPYTLKRLKQWMRYITAHQDKDWFEAIKRTETVESFFTEFEKVTGLD